MNQTQWAAEGSLAKLLAWRVAEQAERDFLYVEDDGPWSYGEIASRAVDYHDILIGAGVGHGDSVLVRVGNDERFPAASFAAWMAGAAVIAMHPSAPRHEIVDVIGSMEPVAIIADPADGPAHESGLLTVEAAPFGPANPAEYVDLAERFAAPEIVAGSEKALVLLTSGSTGKPKGVVLTHEGAWANLRATVSAFRSNTAPTALPREPKPPNLIANPLSHTAGVIRLLFALYVGRSVALLRKFNGVVAKRLIDRHGIDNLTINPTMIRMLLDQLPAGESLGRVRYVSSGTAPLPAALREEFETRFGIPVLQAYGQTEAFGGIAIESVRDVLSGRRKPGSVGKALPGVELRITDAAGAEVQRGQIGELLVRTKSATAGYLGNDAPSPVDAAGWLHTGDRARFDEEGYLYITGRSKNMIICGGFNIIPEEIEAALVHDPTVHDAAVVGVADARLGEIPVALVESDSEASIVEQRAAALLAPYKRPRRLFVIDELPRVTNGKVDRPAATELARTLVAAASGHENGDG